MNSITSAFLGFIFTVLLFAICLIFVVGVKCVIMAIKSKAVTNDTPAQIEKPQNIKPKKPRLKSIKIDPDEIDRIYVRK